MSLFGKRDLIFLKVYPERDNLGDVLLSQLLLAELRKHGDIRVNQRGLTPDACSVLGLSENEVWRLEKWPFELTMRFISLARRLLGRRTFFFGTPGHVYSLSDATGKPASVRGTSLRFLPRLSGLRLCRLGISAGPLSDARLAKLRRTAPRMHHFSVREGHSRGYLTANGVGNVGTVPDLAWLLSASRDERGRDCVLFSFRDSILKSSDGFYRQPEMRQCLFSLLAKVAAAHPLHKIVVAYQVERDRDFSHQLADSLRGSSIDVELIDSLLDFESATALYARAEKVFSNRLHVLLLAFSQGALPIAVIDSNNHSKIRGVFELASLADLVWDIRSTDPTVALNRPFPPPGSHVPLFAENRRKVVAAIDAIFS